MAFQSSQTLLGFVERSGFDRSSGDRAAGSRMLLPVGWNPIDQAIRALAVSRGGSGLDERHVRPRHYRRSTCPPAVPIMRVQRPNGFSLIMDRLDAVVSYEVF